MNNFSSEEFILQIRNRIKKRKHRNTIIQTTSFAIVMCFFLVKSSLLVRHDLHTAQINEFWYSHIEESIMDYELELEQNLSEEDVLEYLIDSMDINDFIQFVEESISDANTDSDSDSIS